MPRFQAGSRYAEGTRVVVTIVVTDIVIVAAKAGTPKKAASIRTKAMFPAMSGRKNPQATNPKLGLLEARPVP